MDHIITPVTSTSHHWIIALLITIVIGIALILIFCITIHLKNKNDTSKKLEILHRLTMLLTIGNIISAICTAIVIGINIGHGISQQNDLHPSVENIAPEFGLSILPGTDPDVRDSNKVWTDKNKTRYTNCYVVSTKVDARHVSSRLFCFDGAKTTQIHTPKE